MKSGGRWKKRTRRPPTGGSIVALAARAAAAARQMTGSMTRGAITGATHPVSLHDDGAMPAGGGNENGSAVTLGGAPSLRLSSRRAEGWLTLSTAAIDTAHEPTFAVGADGRVTSWNDPGAAFINGLPTATAAIILVTARRAISQRITLTHHLEVPGPPGPADDAGQPAAHYELVVMPAAQGAVVIAHQQTFADNLRTALIESRGRFKDFVEIASDLAWETGEDGLLVYVSGAQVLGHRTADMVGRDPGEFLADLSQQSVFRTETRVSDVDVLMRRANGAICCLQTAAMPLIGANGRWHGARGIGRDVTAARVRQAELTRTSSRLRLMWHVVNTFRQETEPEAVVAVATEALAGALKATGCQVFRLPYGKSDEPDNYSTCASFGETGDRDVAREVLQRLRQRYKLLEGEVAPWRLLGIATYFDGRVNGAICLWRNLEHGPWSDDERAVVSELALQVGAAIEQASKHAHILSLSRTDSMTGLLNRRAFRDELQRRFARLQREHRPGAIIYADLDNFKLVNDVHGHRRGDEALLRVRDLLLANTRSTDLIARFGGDEFGLWLDGADHAAAEGRARVLIAAADALREFSGTPERPLQMSLGVAVYDPDNREELEALLDRADRAMYMVKHGGKGSYRFAPPVPGA